MASTTTGNNYFTKSMNSIIEIDDGAGTTISDGNINCNSFTTINFDTDNLNCDSASITTLNSSTINNTGKTTTGTLETNNIETKLTTDILAFSGKEFNFNGTETHTRTYLSKYLTNHILAATNNNIAYFDFFSYEFGSRRDGQIKCTGGSDTVNDRGVLAMTFASIGMNVDSLSVDGSVTLPTLNSTTIINSGTTTSNILNASTSGTIPTFNSTTSNITTLNSTTINNSGTTTSNILNASTSGTIPTFNSTTSNITTLNSTTINNSGTTSTDILQSNTINNTGNTTTNNLIMKNGGFTYISNTSTYSEQFINTTTNIYRYILYPPINKLLYTINGNNTLELTDTTATITGTLATTTINNSGTTTTGTLASTTINNSGTATTGTLNSTTINNSGTITSHYLNASLEGTIPTINSTTANLTYINNSGGMTTSSITNSGGLTTNSITKSSGTLTITAPTIQLSGNVQFSNWLNSQTVGGKALNTTYQNTGTAPKFISISATNSTASVLTAKTNSATPPTIQVAFTTLFNNVGQTIFFIVLPGNYYRVETSAGGTLQNWTEWG